MKRIFVVLLGAFILCASVAFATEIPTTVDINADPRVATITFTDADGGNIQLSRFDNASVTCYGTIYDDDGYTDIISLNASFFGLNSTISSAPSSGTKYVNTSCTITNGAGPTADFECNATVHHHTEPGSWNCTVMVQDAYGVNGSNSTLQTVDTFMSIDVPTELIDFGTHAHGNDSGTNDYSILINNSGNVRFDVLLDAYSLTGVDADVNAMACDVGDLPVASILWNLTPGTDASLKTPFTDSPQTADINLDQTAFGATAYTTDNIYFGISIPMSGQSGTCTGFIDVSATNP
ncbi:MAG TPA: hypothetical protein VK158_06265 [Acidobacteriota bacterium]|nr:hypothetical protein [Acidobacteriota bacterium]